MNSNSTLYTCEITIHRAEHVPIGDLNNFSCDPYIRATLDVPNSHPLSYRTPTIRHTLSPTYNAQWIVSGIPDSGFTLTLRLIDEDPGNRDDRLGKTVVRVPHPGAAETFHKGFHMDESEYKVEKKKGSIRAYVATYLATMVTKGAVSHHARIWVSARVLGKSADQDDRRVFTLGPPKYTQHFSPLIGHLVSGGTASNKASTKLKSDKTLSTSSFVANRLQLAGPPPRSLRHRYVGYAPFIKSLFKASSIRGKILNRALHHQFRTVYSYDKATVYGVAGEGLVDPDGSKNKAAGGEPKSQDGHTSPPENGDPGPADHDAHTKTESHAYNPPKDALAREFLRMTQHGTAGRLFTYIITLDSEWRFTETGEEFSVDLLSKHSMHANVAKEIAYSGEFFVRRMQSVEGENKDEDVVSDVLQDYELVIDNDSGTYRPRKELLPHLQRWLARGENLGALGRVTAMDGFDETLKRWKEERQREKREAKGLKPRVKKGGDGEEDGKEAEGGDLGKMAMPKRGGSVSSVSSGRLGSGHSSVSSSDVEAVMAEDAKRAKENDDDDDAARSEELREGDGKGKDGGEGKAGGEGKTDASHHN